MVNIIILLIIVAVVAVLSVQNSAPVALTFLFWKFETPLSVVIFFSLLAGVVITAIFAFSGYLKRITKQKNSKP